MSSPLESSSIAAPRPPAPPARAVRETRKDLRASIVDASAFSVMVGAGEAYLPAFALALGMGDVTAGLLATLPQLAGAMLQLVSPRGVRLLRSHRRWVVLGAFLQALCFLPLIAFALAGHMPVGWLFLIASFYWGAAQSTGPAWNTWIERLVPRAVRASFFAKRSRVAQTCVLLGLLTTGLLLELGESRGRTLDAFALVFAIAAIARLVSTRYLAAQSEPALSEHEQRGASLRQVARRFGQDRGGRLVLYMLGLQVTVTFSSPFFSPFMLQRLELSYAAYMVLIATAFLARVLAMPLLGRAASRFGPGWLLWFGGLGVAPLSVLWLVSDNFFYLLFIQLVSGAAWGAYELATQLLFFEMIKREERTSFLTIHNVLNATAVVMGSLAGGAILRSFGSDAFAYHLVFALSSLGRLCAALLLLRVAPPPQRLVRFVQSVIAVRPGAGAIVRTVESSAPRRRD